MFIKNIFSFRNSAGVKQFKRSYNVILFQKAAKKCIWILLSTRITDILLQHGRYFAQGTRGTQIRILVSQITKVNALIKHNLSM